MKLLDKFKLYTSTLIFFSGFVIPFIQYSQPALAARSYIFPIIGNAHYSNDYYSPRSDGIHAATDIIAAKGSQLVAMADGTITYVASPQPSWGYSLSYVDDYGYKYRYIHINNDTPGTDDGRGGEMNAYAPDVKPGNRIVAGQLLGYVGDSGNAENTVAHLHLEIEKPDNSPKNPYRILITADKISKPVSPPALENELLPYGNKERNINIATGNLDGDVASEIVTAVASGGNSLVKIYDEDKTFISSFRAYSSGYKGGIDVETGDVDNDGIDEIITGRNGNARVRVYETDGTKIADFFAYSSGFKGDTRVTAGDVDNDGFDEIITGVGRSGNARVSLFELDGTRINSWLVYKRYYQNGIYVSAGDLDGDGVDEIVTGIGFGTGPRIRIYKPDGSKIDDFFAYSTANKGGVRVSVGNVRVFSPEPEILTVPAKGHPRIKMFSASGSYIDDSWFIEDWWRGEYDVAAGYDTAQGAAFENRRPTVRSGIN